MPANGSGQPSSFFVRDEEAWNKPSWWTPAGPPQKSCCGTLWPPTVWKWRCGLSGEGANQQYQLSFHWRIFHKSPEPTAPFYGWLWYNPNPEGICWIHIFGLRIRWPREDTASAATMPKLSSLNGMWKKRSTTIDRTTFSGDECIVYGLWIECLPQASRLGLFYTMSVEDVGYF